MWVYACMNQYPYLCGCLRRLQRSGPLELELTGSCEPPDMMLELGSSRRAMYALNYWDISLALIFTFNPPSPSPSLYLCVLNEGMRIWVQCPQRGSDLIRSRAFGVTGLLNHGAISPEPILLFFPTERTCNVNSCLFVNMYFKYIVTKS